jgi:hypothetical protein
MLQLIAGLERMTNEFTERKERVAAARQGWCAAGEPVPADISRPVGDAGSSGASGSAAPRSSS